ncbi:MAG: Mut7-C RNAse domain-containing protein [Nitrospiraceae bacterium]|nr:Mut7-C RNAse domain-containing protein [Nitrospiraceae bacterium]
MKFIADAMLGRLARWLRLLGFDVLYCRDIEDRELMRISRAEGRTLLTRDTRLARSKGLEAPVLIRSDDVREQLLQLADRLDFAAAAPRGRCDVCNSALEEVAEREQARDSVPEHIYRTCPAFTRCASCGRVYWPGTHSRSFRQTVAGLLRGRRED